MPGGYRGKKSKHNNNRGRGDGPGRGRGRGGPPRNGVPTAVLPPASPSPADRASHPRHRYPHASAEIDAEIQQWVQPIVDGNRNRGRGPWGGSTPMSRSGTGTPLTGIDSPRRGNGTPRRGRHGQGWGRGNGNGAPSGTNGRRHLSVGSKTSSVKAFLGKDAPLSELLFTERPLLRPVKFVRATLTPFLFQESEDMMKPASQIADTLVKPNAPTADRVARVFHRSVADGDPGSKSEVRAPGRLEEIDFADLAQVRAEVDAIALGTAVTGPKDEEIEEVDFTDLAAIRAEVDSAAPRVAAPREDVPEETFTGIYNHVADATLVLGAMNTIDDDQPDEVQQATLPSALPIPDDALPFSKSSNRESTTRKLDEVLIEEVAPCSTDALSNIPAKEPPPIASEKQPASTITSDVPFRPDEPRPFFVVDTAPTYPLVRRSASDVILVDRAGHGQVLGDQDQEDELIVYVAPHPRSGRASPTPAVPRVRSPKMSMLTGTYASREDKKQPREASPDRAVEDNNDEFAQESNVAIPNTSPVDSSHTRTVRKRNIKRQRQSQRKRKRDLLGFGPLGAMVSEARLREGDERERRRPEWSTRCQGDSDLDWGIEDEDGEREERANDDEMDAVSNSLGGMQIDPDIELDLDAMEGFVNSMSADGSQFVTIDDIGGEGRILQEDEESESGPEESSDSEGDDENEEEEEEEEEEGVFNLEEEIMIAESEDEEQSDDSDGNDELSPGTRFQAQLRKVRERSHGPHSETFQEISDDEDEDIPDVFSRRGADDEAFIAHINDLLDKNSHILSGRDRKQKKAVFRQLHKDEWDVDAYLDDPEFTTPVNKKGKKKQSYAGHFAAELEAQWAKDRTKKAEGKRRRQEERELARRESTMDLDVDALEEMMRAFVSGTKHVMALPPMDKRMRKVVHELAAAFGIKSESKGKGRGRYTTLIRTTRTGAGVKEGRVRALMNQYGGRAFGNGNEGRRKREHGRGKSKESRMKEGDEVGGEAPKIGEGNIGFKMLASMGWSEGHLIGGMGSVGIEAPLPAIYRHSKLGLGATK